MTQGPFKVDGIHLEPASVGTALTITRTGSGEMRFQDARVPDGLFLGNMASLSTVAGVLVVGRAGAGAAYGTIQGALDDVPFSSSLTAPTVILIMPGVYTENLTINRAGLTLLALGRVVVTPALSAVPTITVAAAVGSIPTSVSLVGLTVLQPNAGRAAVSVVGGAGSEVAADGLRLERCELVASGLGSFALHADTVNRIELWGCVAGLSDATASVRINQCSGFRVFGGSLPSVQLEYNAALPQPDETSSEYVLQGCVLVGDVLSSLVSEGSLRIASCPDVGDITLNGDRPVTLAEVTAGDVTVNGTTAARARSVSLGSLAGGGTWASEAVRGSVSLDAEMTADVVFSVARPDANYHVSPDAGVSATPWVTDKTSEGFRINFPAPVTTEVSWAVWG